MNRSRAKDYQENRIKMIQELIKESCEFLLEMKIIINATSITKKVEEIFKERKLNEELLVDQQTIGRRKYYNNIWKSYQKKQNTSSQKRGEEKTKDFNLFDIRDKFDMLQQDYIEAIDENKLLEMKINDLKKELETTNLNTTLNNQRKDIKVKEKIEILEIINLITNMINNGPIIISKNDINIIIKDALNINTDNRFVFPIKNWEELLK